MEGEVAALHAAMAEPGFYQQPGDAIAREQTKLKTTTDRLEAAMLRWEELATLAE